MGRYSNGNWIRADSRVIRNWINLPIIMDDEKIEIDDGATRIVLYYNDVMVLQFKKINRNAEIVLTNGAQFTTSATFYGKLKEYCKENDYELVKNKVVDEYNGHIN